MFRTLLIRQLCELERVDINWTENLIERECKAILNENMVRRKNSVNSNSLRKICGPEGEMKIE